ncbi:MAG: hypothetical protein R2715_04540 [Ilumatobacteraceae bacterium]
MQKRSRHSLVALPLVGLLTLAACGSDGDDAASTDTTAATETTAGGAETTAAAGGETTGALAGVCPETVVIQTDWNPEAEHGFLYEMLGDDAEIDSGAVAVRGTLYADKGTVDTGVKLEIRSGGPAIGFQTVTSQIYQDSDILLGYVYTDEGIQNSAEFPTVAVMAPFEKNPQMIMWDPETYPNVKTIADLGTEGVLIRYFGGAAYMEYYLSEGVLSADQVDSGYDGSPAGWLADQGKSAQQGFGSAEPYIYKNEIAEWGKDVAYAYINDEGWNNYAEALATKPENIETYADCFTALVPIIQQATVDYVKDPARTNALIIEAVDTFDNGWVYSQGVADYGVATMLSDGLIANGPDSTLGNFDEARIDDLIAKAIPVYTALGTPPKDGLTAADLVTNQFVDMSIGL